MSVTINITITRGDEWEDSYDVWAKLSSVPLEEGDGVYIGNYPIEPNEDSITIAWTGAQDDAVYNYGFRVVPITRREKGPSGVFVT